MPSHPREPSVIKVEPGLRIGKLTVLKLRRTGAVKSLNVWDCKCDCGNHTTLRQGDVSRINCKRSCGCLAKAAHSKMTKRAFHL